MCDWVAVLSALLTPLIAVIAVYIAYQQWRTNERRLFLDLYDRRLRIYEEVGKIISLIIRDASVEVRDLLLFTNSVREADFLFGAEIGAYIDEIFDHGNSLARWKDEYRDYNDVIPADYNHKKVVEGKSGELEWFSGQLENAKQKFHKYLAHEKQTLRSRILRR